LKVHRDWNQFKQILPTLGKGNQEYHICLLKAYYFTGAGKSTLMDVEFDFGKPIESAEGTAEVAILFSMNLHYSEANHVSFRQ
jgi:hypothetical protein